MTNTEVAERFTSVWDGKSSLAGPHDRKPPPWLPSTERKCESRLRKDVRKRRASYPWPVKKAVLAAVRGGQSTREAAAEWDVPYCTARSWVHIEGRR